MTNERTSQAGILWLRTNYQIGLFGTDK